MEEVLLDFRKLLKLLAKLYGENEFDTRTVAEGLSEYFFKEIDDPKILIKLIERVRPKLISNDLRRLYMMGFLRRRKVPRTCENEKGKRYNCGYKYMYSINKQGWSYLRQLMEDEEKHSSPSLTADDLKEILEEMRFGIMKLNMVTAPDTYEARGIWNFYKNELREKFSSPGFRRFTRKRELFEREASCWMNMFYLGMQVFPLEKEIQLKDLMIDYLKRELEACMKFKSGAFSEILEMSKNIKTLGWSKGEE
ncbi:hypothetical protein [Thermococcus waiotapuensis]|uniref:Uncharacterized protein n=1 Tax=Thermococcus waiotapuensis TaxID=90909 RepID=A0AAE4NTJ9_9EURY|nr:hypothetical protein [Thermococcus waiotapuensis]MDV3104083.1 hypothetical protein [Thermococcus waiotapuensis]